MDELKTGTAAAGNVAKEAKPVKYRCEITCYDGKHLYREGDDYEFPAGVKPFREDYFTKL